MRPPVTRRETETTCFLYSGPPSATGARWAGLRVAESMCGVLLPGLRRPIGQFPEGSVGTLVADWPVLNSEYSVEKPE